MARNERAQWARLDFDGVPLLVDLAAGVSLARAIEFDETALRCFGAPAAHSAPLVVGDFSGSVARGASCNCSTITLTPHANGTHTEGVGHLTLEPLPAHTLLPRRLIATVLLSVTPERAAESSEGSTPTPQPDDRLITQRQIERAWPATADARLSARAVMIRTLPNTPGRFGPLDASNGAASPPPPFLSAQAAQGLVERGIEHLLLDVPSADRLADEGELTAHRLFFGLPRGSRALGEARRRECTITELAYAADATADGWYLLSLQGPAIAGDAVPTRPVLYPLRKA